MLNLYWEQFLQILFKDPQHAWILLSIIFLLSTLFFQAFFTGSVRKASKRVSSKNLKSLQGKYLFRSLVGWFFYLCSWSLFLMFWYAHYFNTYELQKDAFYFAAGSIGIFLISIIYHLKAYATSCLDQIKQLEDQQLTP